MTIRHIKGASWKGIKVHKKTSCWMANLKKYTLEHELTIDIKIVCSLLVIGQK